jgi:hypothetical protein
MALPKQILTPYEGLGVGVEDNNNSGFNFALQCQNKLVMTYITLPYSPQIFLDICASIKTDVEYNQSTLLPPGQINNPPYPNWLKIAYQVVTQIGQDFEASCVTAGYVNGMTYYQLFELLFNTPVDLYPEPID